MLKRDLVMSVGVCWGIKEADEDPHEDAQPLKAAVWGLLSKQLYLALCVDAWLSQPDRGPLLELAAADRNNTTLSGRRR